MLSRGSRRRLSMGLATVLGLKKRGFFIPYRYADGVGAPERYPAFDDLFQRFEPDFSALLDQIQSLAPDIEALEGGDRGCQLDQGWFPRLDALSAYAMIRDRKPARIVEIGSGHSTHFMAAAITDGGLQTALTCIDPAPRASLADLDIVWRKSLVQSAPKDDIKALGPGDLLFVDSSHILMPGTDVDYLISELLPLLPSGAFLHVHDIFFPEGYPKTWAWRGYNEQPAIAALLQGGGYRPLFSSRYVATQMTERLARTPLLTPCCVTLEKDDFASSLWLEKR